MRLLFDVTQEGHDLVVDCFGLAHGEQVLREPWNHGKEDDPHIGSVMLGTGSIKDLTIYALATRVPDAKWVIIPENGYPHAVREPTDDEWRQMDLVFKNYRRFKACYNSNGRHQHMASGRFE